MYAKVLNDMIEMEKNGESYVCVGNDRIILSSLLNEVNNYSGANFQYLAELSNFTIEGTGEIFARYIPRFQSQSVRGFLIHHLTVDKLKECDKLILKLYQDFKASDEYISPPGKPSPAHIYVRFDNAIKKLKPKRLKPELIQLFYCPRDFFYLPFTMRMLASWKTPELQDKLIKYSSELNIIASDVGLFADDELYYPPFSAIKRQIRFTAINSLQYYPTQETMDVLYQYMISDDKDIKAAAKKVLKKIEAKM